MTTTQETLVERNDLTDRFWLIIREPGMVPDRKGPWKHTETARVLREFMAANPRAFIDVLTIGADGEPYVDHGPETLQMIDGRSMSVGRKHNERVKAAAIEALALTPPIDDVTRSVPDGWKLGNRVEKISGSAWHGRVVGFYSTSLTPVGYAVESEREPGSVRIYPAKALRSAMLSSSPEYKEGNHG